MRVDSGQWTVVRKKDVGTQNETRENIMLTYNDQTKARFPLSLDGRGVRGEGVALPGKAGLLLATCLLYLAPAPAALAQNECGVQVGTTPVICDQDSYTGGVTYDAVGDLFIDFTASPTTEIEAGGIDLIGDGSESITFDSATTNTELESRETIGPLLDVSTVDGNIDIMTEEVDADGQTPDGVTHGIRAEATGLGNVDITTTGNVDTDSNDNPADSIGIEALSGSGDITLSAGGDVLGNAYGIRAVSTDAGNIDITATDSLRGDQYGIFAETGGAGSVVLNLGDGTAGSGPRTNGVGDHAVRVTNGTGDVQINATSDIRPGRGFHDSWDAGGIHIDSGGDIDIQSTHIIAGGTDSSGGGAVPAITADGNQFHLSFTGAPGDSLEAIHNVFNYRAGLGGMHGGAGGFLSASGDLPNPDVGEAYETGGHVDLSGVTGGADLRFQQYARWSLSGSSQLSEGDDLVYFDDTSILITVQPGGTDNGGLPDDVTQEILPPGIIDFGAGEDRVQNEGRWLLGPVFTTVTNVGVDTPNDPPVVRARTGLRGEVQLFNLNRFDNSGEIWLGAKFHRPAGGSAVNHWPLAGTDSWTDDLLYMPGARFHGEAGSVVHMDVDLNQPQDSCAPSTRDANGWLPAADCIGIQGGSATGRTELVIYERIPGDRGDYNPDGIVLVDLAGGDPEDTDLGAFVVSPDTPRYADIGPNGSIDKGLFLYALAFDSELQQFRLYGVPGTGGQQFPILATAANQLWRTATGGWFERRVSQRDVEREAGLGTGTWFNLSRGSAERDITTLLKVGATPDFVFNNDYEQDDTTLSFGWDLIAHDTGSGSWVFGGMVGYARSEVEFAASGNSANMEGVHAGLYGSYTIGDFFVDAALNGTWTDLQNDVPTMNLQPEGTLLDTDVESRGLQLEAGWRLRMGSLSVEPLLGYSMVSTDFDDMNVPADDPERFGGTVKLSDSESRRASAGVRVALEDLFSRDYPVALNLTARAIEEFDGESKVTIVNTGPLDAPSADKFDDTLFQLTGGVSVTNAPKTLNGYLNVDATTGDDYDSLGISLGFRAQW